MKTIQICETNKCVVSECQFAKMKISYKFGISVCTRYSISNTMVMFHKEQNSDKKRSEILFIGYGYIFCNEYR